MRYQQLLIPIIIFVSIGMKPIFAQEQLGLKLDNYAGVNSVLLNPSLPVTSPYKWDVNLISFAGFFDNSYAFIENASAFDMIRASDIRSRPDFLENPEGMPENPLIADYFTNSNKKWASGLMTIMGPSAMLNLDSDWGFSLFTQFRMGGQTRQLPTALDYYPYDAVPRDQQISATPFKGTMMAWGELGFNASKKIDTYYGLMAIGGTFKMIGGLEAVYGAVNDDFILTKRGNDTLQVQSVNSTFGFTTSNADIYDSSSPMQNINGFGAGLDFGVQFVFEGEPEQYQWRVGAALVDVGRVSFVRNAHSYHIETEDVINLVYSRYEEYTNPIDVSSQLSQDALGDSEAAFQNDRFNIWLPAALNVHGDYAFTDNFYLAAALIQRIPLGKHYIDRNNVFTLTPRLESRWFSLMLPANILNYEQVHLGIAARLGLITIGTDNFGSYFRQNEFTGSDFYFALKLNPFKLKGSGKSRGGRVRCYDF